MCETDDPNGLTLVSVVYTTDKTRLGQRQQTAACMSVLKLLNINTKQCVYSSKRDRLHDKRMPDKEMNHRNCSITMWAAGISRLYAIAGIVDGPLRLSDSFKAGEGLWLQ